MPVNRRQFSQGESPRLSQVEPQGSVQFQLPLNGEWTKAGFIPNAQQPEKRLIVVDESPSLDYAWAISQISVPVLVVSQVIAGVEGEFVPPLGLNVRGLAGSQIIFSSANIQGAYTRLGGTFSATVYAIDLTPFSPYPIRGGQQISMEFELASNTEPIQGKLWATTMVVGYVPTFTYVTSSETPFSLEVTSYPGVLSYRYV